MESNKLIKLFDFKGLELPEQLFGLSYRKEDVENALEAVREKFLTIEEVTGPVVKGDIAVISLPATDSEDAKQVQINVCKYFYDNDFEDSLVGLEKGAAVTMPRRDLGRAGTLAQIKRRVLPALTDTLIARLGIEGADTMDGYRAVVRQELVEEDKQKKANAILTMILREVTAKSEFGDITEEIDAAFEKAKEQFRDAAQQREMSYEEALAQFTPSQYETLEQRETYLRESAEAQAKQHLIAQYYFEQDGKVLDQAGFEAFKQFYLDKGMDRNQVEQQLTYEVYCDSAPLQYYQELAMACYENRFKVVEK